MLNGLDLFSGIGGFTVALASWVRPIAYCEIDPYCQTVLLDGQKNGRIPIAPIWDDIVSFPAEDFVGAVDIVYGGFPCQDISIAGAQAGLEGGRSRLFFRVIDIVRTIRPSFVFLENVPAIVSLGLERIGLEFSALGYDCRWTIVSAGELGAPHLRERWWLCAHADRSGLSQSGRLTNAQGERRRATRNPTFGVVQSDLWKKPASEFSGMDDGIPPKTHRIRALGNAVVPHAAREAFERLIGIPK